MEKIYLIEIIRNSNKNIFVLKSNEKYYYMNNNLNKIVKFIQKDLNLKLSENIFLSEFFIKTLLLKKGFIFL